MQLFFNKIHQSNKVLPRPASWNYAKAGLRRNISTVVGYYQNKGFAVKSNHFLVRLINIVSVDHSLHLERFYEIVNAKTNRLSMNMKMTSSVYSGQLFDGIFYGPKTKEIIIADDEYISPYEIEKNWKNIQSVKVLDHPRSELNLLLPNGKDSSTEGGIASIVVNIPALATQYRQFAIEQHERMGHGESPSTTALFVHRYVLPNMLYTHQDIALFNRFNNMAIGKPMSAGLGDHPFFLIDYSKQVDDVYRDIVRRMESIDTDFWTMLRSIPLSNTDTALELMRLPEVAPTRQVAWAEFLSRLKCILFLITSAPEHGRKLNGNDVNYLLRRITNYTLDGTFRQITHNEIYEDIVRMIRSIAEMTSAPSIPIR